MVGLRSMQSALSRPYHLSALGATKCDNCRVSSFFTHLFVTIFKGFKYLNVFLRLEMFIVGKATH